MTERDETEAPMQSTISAAATRSPRGGAQSEPADEARPLHAGRAWRGLRQGLSIYLELAKARLATLVILTTVAGFLVASAGTPDAGALAWTVIGTALTAFGANILNQWLEIEPDRRMRRTSGRPLPSGRITPTRAAVWGVVSAVAGLAVLVAGVNLITAALSGLVILLYVGVYTPLKRRSSVNTLIGAVCGAIPPMMGWTAVTGRIELGAWVLFAILFLWQIPHFLALAWLYREDYARGGFCMLPAADPTGRITGRAALIYALALLPLTAVVWLAGLSGRVFLAGSQVLGLALAGLALGLLLHRTSGAARRLFVASIVYLPLLLTLMVLDVTAQRPTTVSPGLVRIEQTPAATPSIGLEPGRAS